MGGPSFIDPQEEAIFSQAKLGEDVRAFLSSHPVGILLHERAKALIRQARADALEVDPDGWGSWFRARRKLRQARLNAAVGTAFIDWMAEAILEGEVAAKQLEEYRK